MANTQDMTKGPIAPILLKFTLPIFLGDMFQQFYNIVDSIIVGRTLGANALAAVGSTGTLMFLIVGVSTTLANGFAVVTAQKFGAKDKDGVHVSFANGLIQTIIISGIISAISLLFIKKLLVLMNTPEDIYNDACLYISIIIEGLIITSLYNYFAASLRSVGNSRIPLYFLILASFINIFLDQYFIVKLNMGTDGASKATVISQFVSALFCFIYIYTKEPGLRPGIKDFKMDKEICLKQLEIGVPMALQNAITASGTVIMQSATNIFGSTVVAANTAAGKVRMLFTQPLMSLNSSVASYCGQNYGSGDYDRVRQGVKISAIMATVYSVVATVLANLLLPAAIHLFITDESSIEAMMPWAKTYMMIASCFIFFLGYVFVYRAALQSCGHSVYAMGAGIIEFLERLVFAALAIHYKSYILAVLCDCSAWAMGGLFLIISFYVFDHKKKLFKNR